MIQCRRALAVALGAVLATGVGAQEAQPEVTVTRSDLGNGLYVMITGRGGNVGLSVGDDGAWIIDDQFAPLAPKFMASIREVTDAPVRFVINTHWHGDHSGGNAPFAEQGAVILAHDNVYARMSTEQSRPGSDRVTPPSPRMALPVVTYNDRMTMRLNGDTAHVIHVHHAHTDGDSLIYFEKANVLHMGDTYFNGLYPFIDTGSGGGINGFIAALDKGLEISDDDTQIIPGHGPMSNKQELQTFRDMMHTIRERVRELKTAGKTLEEVQAAGVSKEWDEALGGVFITPPMLAQFVYDSL